MAQAGSEDGASNSKDIIQLTLMPIQTSSLVESVKDDGCGAVSLFIGTTRDTFQGKKVVKLEYEAYESMAVAQIRKICGQIRERWNVKHIAIVHRLGEVPVREESIVIVISSAHRKDSLASVEYAIDTIKAVATIWKKEIYESDEPVWKENSEWNSGKLANN